MSKHTAFHSAQNDDAAISVTSHTQSLATHPYVQTTNDQIYNRSKA